MDSNILLDIMGLELDILGRTLLYQPLFLVYGMLTNAQHMHMTALGFLTLVTYNQLDVPNRTLITMHTSILNCTLNTKW